MSAIDKNIIRRLGLTILVMVAASVNISAQDSPSGLRIVSSSTTTQLSQFGITWSFSEPVEYGTYVNGDYWVVGPVEIVNISPASIEVDGRVINGSMVNPLPGQIQGFDSATRYMDYQPVKNVSRPNGARLSAANSLLLSAHSSLVTTISHPTAGERPQLSDAAILTVVSAPPPLNAFRPAYSSVRKKHAFVLSNVDASLLHSLPPVSGTPSMDDVAAYFERPWIDFQPRWTARYLHPSNNMPDYGREMSTQVGVGALMLHLDFSEQDKRELLVRYLQLGIDFWGIVQNGGDSNWTPDGGHASGRKWPILFAGLLFGDPDMLAIGPGDGTGVAMFGEDAQTFYVDDNAITITNDVDRWNPDSRTEDPQPYDDSLKTMPEWGLRHASDATRDDASWNATYRTCCTATAWSGFVLAARIMSAVSIWDHSALFAYQDRYMAIMAGNPDPDGFSVHGQPTAEQGAFRSWSSFTGAMWDKHRASF